MKNIINKLFIAMIIVGVALVAYPLVLKIQTELEMADIKAQIAEVGSENQLSVSDNQATTASAQGVTQQQQVATAKTKATFLLQIPKISLDVPVVEIQDISIFDQKITQLPARYPNTGLPGEQRNLAIAGHVNGPAGYFAKLKQLVEGDRITLYYNKQRYNYQVERVFVTTKDDWSVINTGPGELLTLTTCERVGFETSAKRLVVQAKRVD